MVSGTIFTTAISHKCIVLNLSDSPLYRYLVSFLLDSSVGLLVIYAGIRITVALADKYDWKYLYFGIYGNC